MMTEGGLPTGTARAVALSPTATTRAPAPSAVTVAPSTEAVAEPSPTTLAATIAPGPLADAKARTWVQGAMSGTYGTMSAVNA
jgi:hypothetical protein